jgi:hypothetical protein
VNVFVLLFLSTLNVEYRPAQPRVGDPVRVTFSVGGGDRIEIAPDETYEIVSATPSSVTVRSFRPGPFTLRGAVIRGTERESFRGPEIRVGTVLGPQDDLKPAPLVPPKPLPASPYASRAVWGAAVFAALSWLALFALMRRRPAPSEGAALAEFDYGEVVRRLRGRLLTQAEIAILSDATRRHLALGMELTTTELLDALRSNQPAVAAAREILCEGDLAKFSPWGSSTAGSDRLTSVAERLVAATRERSEDAPAR